MATSNRNVLKTKVHDADVLDFIDSFANTDQKRQDSLELIELMSNASGFPPKMWGASMIGFGAYHYKSGKSQQEGDWFLVGFSPRKAAISLYVYSGLPEHEPWLEGLGQYQKAKACLYVKKVSDIDLKVLQQLIKKTITYLRKKYP